MREIKFRAWDKELESMLVGNNQYGSEEPGISLHLLSSGTFTRLWESLAIFKESERFTLMQYTGLKDKNGVEIYEGDVFHANTKGTDMQGEIYFKEGCFRMKYGYQNPKKDERKDYFLSSVILNDGAAVMEIIGNIYETPELLNTEGK